MATRLQAVRAEPTTDHTGAWSLAVERGPDWLFVRVESDPTTTGPASSLADTIWGMIREHHASRVVLELDRVDAIDEPLIGAIAEVGTRVRREGGLIRACGLSQPNLDRLKLTPATAVPHFGTRSEAVGTRCCGSGSCE